MKQLKNEKENSSARMFADKEKINSLTMQLEETKLQIEQLEAKLIVANAQLQTMKKQKIMRETTLEEDDFNEVNYVLIKNFEALKCNPKDLIEVQNDY